MGSLQAQGGDGSAADPTSRTPLTCAATLLGVPEEVNSVRPDEFIILRRFPVWSIIRMSSQPCAQPDGSFMFTERCSFCDYSFCSALFRA